MSAVNKVNAVNAVNKVNAVQTARVRRRRTIVVGTFHVPSSVINQVPATFAGPVSMISPKSSLGIRANVISCLAFATPPSGVAYLTALTELTRLTALTADRIDIVDIVDVVDSGIGHC